MLLIYWIGRKLGSNVKEDGAASVNGLRKTMGRFTNAQLAF